jgi:hypothetical protein
MARHWAELLVIHRVGLSARAIVAKKVRNLHLFYDLAMKAIMS